MMTNDEWLKAYDLHIESSLACRGECDCGGDQPCNHLGAIWYVATLHEPKVGIFGQKLSEAFECKEDLEKWLQIPKNRSDIELRALDD